VVLLVGQNPDDQRERVVVPIKNNLAELAEPIAFEIVDGRFYWKGVTDVTAERLLEPEGQHREQGIIRKEGVAFLQEVLSDGEEHLSDDLLKEAEQQFGISRATLFRAKKELGVEAFRKGVESGAGRGSGRGGRWFWRLRVSTVSVEILDTVKPPQIQNGSEPSEGLRLLNDPAPINPAFVLVAAVSRCPTE
jgi:hypothetical protein